MTVDYLKNGVILANTSLPEPITPEYVSMIESNLDLNFVPSKDVYGGTIYKSSPSKRFWQVYKDRKELLKLEGIVVYKIGKGKDDYVISFKPNPELYKQISIRNVKEFESFVKKLKIPKLLNKLLLKWQLQRLVEICYGIHKYNGVLDGSEMGTGKTLQNLAYSVLFKTKAFAVVPASVVTQWRQASKFIGAELIDAVSYDTLKRGTTPYVKYDKVSDKFIFNQRLIPKNTHIIFDEAHKCKNPNTMNSKLLLGAKKQNYKLSILSATIGHTPLHLKVTGYAIDLFNQLSSYYSWAMDHGVYLGNVGKKDSQKKALIFSNLPSSLIKINNAIYGSGKGVRTKISDLGDDFPKNNIVIQAYDMVEEKKIKSVFTKMRKELNELKKQKSKDKDSKFTIILRARQEVELLKVPNFLEMTEEGLENGLSVVIFVNFKQTLESLRLKLKSYNPCIIKGGQTPKVRLENTQRFQANKTKVALVMIQAGGTGINLHDEHGGHPRMSLISPTYNPNDLVQATGRIARATSKSPSTQKIIFACNTIEELVVEAIQQKKKNLTTINDGELNKGYE